MGVEKITLYDDDLVNEENIATQFLSHTMMEIPKVYTVRNNIWHFSDETEVKMHKERVTEYTDIDACEMIISAVDSINARKDIWKAIQGKFIWYLDARMMAEEFQLYTVKGSDTGWYQEFIGAVSEEDVPDLPCTAKATIYTAAMAAGWIGACARAYLTDWNFPKILIHNIKERTIVQV